MKFKKYPSLTNKYNTSYLEKMQSVVPENQVWYVTEKVHGANLQISGERVGKEISYYLGSRNNYTDLSFFGIEHSNIFMDSYARAKLLLNHILEKHKEVRIYGELFGGNIQKGIFYSEEKRFRAFDIEVDGELLPINEALELYDMYMIDYCTILFKGTLLECLAHTNEFDSLVNSEICMEDIREENVCEGIVIRPTKPFFLDDGSLVAVKDKNDTWFEKSRLPKDANPQCINTSSNEYLQLLTLINANRINSAISKIGREPNNIFKIMREVKDDIINESLESSDSFERKILERVCRVLSKRIIELIKKEIFQ